MIDKKIINCLVHYEKRTFLGALIHYYRVSKKITFEKIMDDLNYSKSEISMVIKGERLATTKKFEVLKKVIDYLEVPEEEIKLFPDINNTSTMAIFDIKNLKKTVNSNVDIIKMLNMNPKTFYKYQKYVDDVEIVNVDEAEEIFKNLYFMDKPYPLRAAKMYCVLLMNDSNKTQLAKLCNTTKTTIQNIEAGISTKNNKKIEERLLSLWCGALRETLETFK